MNVIFTTIALYGSERTLGFLLIGLMLVIIALAIAAPYITWFRQELKYINIEIQRNKENKKEQDHWKRRKRRLLMSLIPFVPYE